MPPIPAFSVPAPSAPDVAPLDDERPFTEYRVSLVSDAQPMLFTRVAPARDMQTAIIRAIAEFESLNGPTKRWLCVTVRNANIKILTDATP